VNYRFTKKAGIFPLFCGVFRKRNNTPERTSMHERKWYAQWERFINKFAFIDNRKGYDAKEIVIQYS